MNASNAWDYIYRAVLIAGLVAASILECPYSMGLFAVLLIVKQLGRINTTLTERS